MTALERALERIEANKADKPLCNSCGYAKKLISCLGCGYSGKLVIPGLEPRKCEHYEEKKWL